MEAVAGLALCMLSRLGLAGCRVRNRYSRHTVDARMITTDRRLTGYRMRNRYSCRTRVMTTDHSHDLVVDVECGTV